MPKVDIKGAKAKLKEDTLKIKEEVQEKTLSYIGGGLGVVAGLAWNDAIKSLIDFAFPNESSGILAQFLYAIAITVIVVAVTMYLSKLLKRK